MSDETPRGRRPEDPDDDPTADDAGLGGTDWLLEQLTGSGSGRAAEDAPAADAPVEDAPAEDAPAEPHDLPADAAGDVGPESAAAPIDDAAMAPRLRWSWTTGSVEPVDATGPTDVDADAPPDADGAAPDADATPPVVPAFPRLPAPVFPPAPEFPPGGISPPPVFPPAAAAPPTPVVPPGPEAPPATGAADPDPIDFDSIDSRRAIPQEWPSFARGQDEPAIDRTGDAGEPPAEIAAGPAEPATGAGGPAASAVLPGGSEPEPSTPEEFTAFAETGPIDVSSLDTPAPFIWSLTPGEGVDPVVHPDATHTAAEDAARAAEAGQNHPVAADDAADDTVGDDAAQETPVAAVPATDTAGTDGSVSDESGTDETGTDESGTGESGIDESGTGERGIDERGIDESGIDERGADERAADEPIPLFTAPIPAGGFVEPFAEPFADPEPPLFTTPPPGWELHNPDPRAAEENSRLDDIGEPAAAPLAADTEGAPPAEDAETESGPVEPAGPPLTRSERRRALAEEASAAAPTVESPAAPVPASDETRPIDFAEDDAATALIPATDDAPTALIPAAAWQDDDATGGSDGTDRPQGVEDLDEVDGLDDVDDATVATALPATAISAAAAVGSETSAADAGSSAATRGGRRARRSAAAGPGEGGADAVRDGGPGAAGGTGSGGAGGGRNARTTRILFWVAGGLLVLLVLIGLYIFGRQIPAMTAAKPTPTPTATATKTPVPTASPTPTAAATGPQGPGVHAWDTLRGGECLQPFTSPWAQTFTVVDCAAPHAAQMVYTNVFSSDAAAAFPGAAQLASQINLLCTKPGIVNMDAAGQVADAQIQGSYPVTEKQWKAGQRSYFCFVNRSGSEPLTGSMQGAGPTS